MKIIKRGIAPAPENKPAKLIGECVECGTVIECMSDEEHLTPHYYGDPGHFTSCPVCEYVLWVY